MTAHERPHLARALLDLERQLTEERQRREALVSALPDAVVAELFRNGFGEQAERLAMKDAGERDLGGWCKTAVKDRVRAALRRAGEGA